MRGAVVWFGLGLTLMFILFVVIFGADSFLSLWKRAGLFMGALGLFAGGMFTRLRRAKRHLRIGADGISVRHRGKRRFFPWHAVVGLKRGVSHRLFLRTIDEDIAEDILIGTDIGRGTKVRGPAVSADVEWVPELPAGARLADLIQSALTHRLEHGRIRCAEVIEGKKPAEWARALKEAMESGDYRGRALAREDLFTDLNNPDAPPELRAVIARLLRPRVEELPRMRAIYDKTAAPEVQDALEQTLKTHEAS